MTDYDFDEAERMGKPTEVGASIRGFVAALAVGREPTEAEVRAAQFLAHRATPKSRGEFTPDDLVGRLVERLLSIPTHSRAKHFDALLAMTDPQLTGTLRVRFLQVAAEAGARWQLVRSIREHVTALLAEGVPTHSGDWPPSLLDGERFSRALIRQAAACAIREGTRPERIALSAALLKQYIPDDLAVGFVDPDGQGEPTDAEALYGEHPADPLEDRVRRVLDRKSVGGLIREALGPELLRVLLLDARGRNAREVGEALGHGTTKAWTQMKRARETLRLLIATDPHLTGGTMSMAIGWLSESLDEKEDSADDTYFPRFQNGRPRRPE